MWLLLHRFRKFAFSVKTIRLHDSDIIIRISFSNISTLETVSTLFSELIIRISFSNISTLETVSTFQIFLLCFQNLL